MTTKLISPFDGFEGTFNGTVGVRTDHHEVARVQIHRSLYFNRDSDNTWIVVAERPESSTEPEDEDGRPGWGQIQVCDDGANALLDMVADLMARPDNFKRSVTFGNDGDHAHDGPHASRDLPNGSQG